MKNIFRPLLLTMLFLTVFFLGACSKNTENEHLPEYCQTYAGFTSVASKDFYELLKDQSEKPVTRRYYIDAISQISLEFIVDDANREIDLSGIQCFQNLTNLTLIGKSFKDLSPINALNNLQSIELRGTSVVSIDSFKNLSKIKSLKISETRTLQSVVGIEEMTKLTDLDLSSNGIVVIDGLNNLVNLETLYLNDNEIISFPSINQLGYLTHLDISDNNINQLGEDLSGLNKLKTLNAQNNEICDLSTLDDLISLETLNLSNNDLGCGGIFVSPNFDSLENAPNLEELHLDNNNLTSIEGLRGRDINLERLYINDNNLTDITPIGEYTGIIELYLDNNNISNIDDLSGMTGLTIVDLSNNNIDEFSDLLIIPNLVDINLSFNNITTIPDISASWSNLSILDLSSNNLSDTSGVNGHQTLESLIIYNNGLNELKGISNLPELDNLVIFDEELELELDPLDVNPNSISIIRNSFNNLESLQLQVDNEFDFGFELADSIEIYESINGLTDIVSIIFTDMDIDIIDNLSINLPNLKELFVDENNITDISFILGNPLLERLYINDNTISNLEVISGVDTSDLDNLEHVVASNITADNNLVDSFIQLPNLSTIDLTNTAIVTVSNSFNDLSSLTLINVDADNLLTIEDSFNNIFSSYETSNRFDFTSGMIGVINNSFNDGIYDRIRIIDQSTTEATTTIVDSFNNIELRAAQGIIIERSNFATIDNSFKGVETDALSLANNEIEVLTNSFIDSTIIDTLDLSNNLIETVPSLNQVTSVYNVNLNTNHLVTLDFVEAVPGIEILDISVQRNELTTSYTLASIDGINNMPSLTTLILGDIGVTSIDGLRNIGITSFEFSYSDNNDKQITSISPTSFTSTPLTILDLDEYELDDITFIDNLDVLESLYIGINLANLSDFQTQGFETTLEFLTILNVQDASDLSYLSNYDILTNLTYSSPATTTINNLDGMESLVSLALDFTQITDISNSFNDLPNYNLNNIYLEQFTILDTITNSFDIYGDLNHSGMVNLSAGITVVDSFNNLEILNIEDNVGDLTPNFDLNSFDVVQDIQFDSGNYSSFAFLNDYTSLTEVSFTDLDVAITNLVNDNIELLKVDNADLSVNSFILDLNPNATFELTTLRNGQITIEGDFINYDLNAQNADIVITSSALSQTLSTNIQNMILNADSAISVELDGYESNTSTFNTTALTSVSRLSTFETNASLFTINSSSATLNVSAKVSDLVINDNNADNYILDVVGGTITLNNAEPGLDVEAYGTNLDINYNELENLILDGEVGNVNITSDNLDSITTAATTITTLNVGSTQPVMTLSGTDITTLNLTNDNINDLTASLNNADLIITSINNELLNANITADTVTFNANNIPSMIFSNTSSMDTLDLTNNNSLSSLTYGTASIPNIELATAQSNLTILGSTSSIVLSGAILNVLNIESPLSNVEIIDSDNTLTVDLDVATLLFDNTTLQTLNVVALSSVDSLTVANSLNFETLNSNDSNITNLSVNSNVPTLNIDAVNAVNNIIQGASYTSITADFGTNDVNIGSTNSTLLELNIVASELIIDTDTTNLDLLDTSSLNDLLVTDSSLTSLSTGNASITNLEVSDSSGDLDISGTNIGSVIIDNHDIQLLDVTTNLSASLEINSLSAAGIDVTTTTSEMTLTANGNSSVESSTLDNITFNVGTNDIQFTVNKTNLDFTINGLAEKAIINGADVDSIITTSNTSLGTLELNNIDVDVLDFTIGVVDILDVTTLLTSINITGDEVETVIIDGVNLTTIDATSNNPISSLDISTSTTNLDLNSNIVSIDIINNNLTSLDVAGVTANSLTVQANSLGNLDTSTSITSVVDISTIQNTFTLLTSATTIDFVGTTIGTLNLTNTNTGLTVLNTNTDTLDVDSSSSTLSIDGSNLNQINGSIDSATLTNTTGTLTLDITAVGTLELNNDTVTSIIFTGVNTINELDISSTSATTVNTNSVDINTLKYEANANDTVVTSNSDIIELSSSGIAEITLTYGGATLLDLQSTVSNSVILNVTTASSLNVNSSSSSLSIEGNNLNQITGNTTGTMTLDLSVTGTLAITNNTVASIIFTGVNTIDELVISSTSATIINTNSVDVTRLIYEANANDTIITTTTNEVELSTTGNAAIALNYSGVALLDLIANVSNRVNVNLSVASSLDVEGEVTLIMISGDNINTVTTDLLTVYNTLTMNGTLIDNLDFISTDVLTNIDTIEVDTLSNSNIDSIMAIIDDSLIDLISPIVDLDVYNYYYDAKVIELEAQEVIDTVRYDGFRDTAINNAWDEIFANQYMDYLVEATTKLNEIDAQNYQTAEQYFAGYLLDSGLTEGDFTPTQRQDIIDEIQLTIDNPLLTISEVDLNAEVTASIVADATIFATTEQTNDTFTLS